MDSTTKQAEWDEFFIGMADYVSTRSKDPSTKVGAVIVRPDGKTIASLGYNGFPRGMSDDPALYADREVKYSRIVHAEMNAILNAGGSVDGCTLYTSKLPPCDRCAVFVAQAGITRVVYENPAPEVAERWAASLAKTQEIFADAGIPMVGIDFPRPAGKINVMLMTKAPTITETLVHLWRAIKTKFSLR
jgi:dCMP deaminase